MRRTTYALLAVAAVSAMLSACSYLDLSKLGPPDANAPSCPSGMLKPATANIRTTAAAPIVDDKKFKGFELSPRASRLAKFVAQDADERDHFQNFVAAATSVYDKEFPDVLKNDPVVIAIQRVMVKTSAHSQLQGAKIAGAVIPKGLQDAVDKYDASADLDHDQMKKFAKNMMRFGLVPSIGSVAKKPDLRTEVLSSQGSAPVADTPPQGIAGYFYSLYKGSFTDRLGKKVAKPDISLTISDAEIAAALTVLVEYTIDLIDPTPVLGDTDSGSTAKKFFPGASADKPTALVAGLANYAQLPPDGKGCGLDQKNIGLLTVLANGASDQASAVGGLVTGSFGGFEVGLGFLGKFSLGDNQTLSTIAKTAASRLALRATLAASYATLKNADLRGLPLDFSQLDSGK